MEIYQKATKISLDHLKPSNPISIGLAINYSSFLYELNIDTK